MRLDTRLLLHAGREDLEGRYDQRSDHRGSVRDDHANSHAEGVGAGVDRKTEREPARSGRSDAGRLEDDLNVHESPAAVLLGRRRARHLRMVLHTVAVDFTEKHLLLRGFAVAGGLLQRAVLHRGFPADQHFAAAQ